MPYFLLDYYHLMFIAVIVFFLWLRPSLRRFSGYYVLIIYTAAFVAISTMMRDPWWQYVSVYPQWSHKTADVPIYIIISIFPVAVFVDYSFRNSITFPKRKVAQKIIRTAAFLISLYVIFGILFWMGFTRD